MKKIYVIARYIQIPKNPKNTARKGFGQNPDNMAFNEAVIIARTIKNKDWNTANVILNITDEKVEKCNLKRDATYQDLYRYYKSNYPQYFHFMDKTPSEAVVVTPEGADDSVARVEPEQPTPPTEESVTT